MNRLLSIVVCMCIFSSSHAQPVPGDRTNTETVFSVLNTTSLSFPVSVSEDCWRYINSISNKSLVSVSFPDSLHGIVLENISGAVNILSTKDGGTTWQRFIPEDHYPDGVVCVVDSSLTYVLMVGGNLYKTVNGGTTWTHAKVGSEVLYYSSYGMDFINDSIGMIIWDTPDGSVIQRTTDGGLSWTNINIAVRCFSITCLDSVIALAYGFYGIYRTENGGISWNQVYTGQFNRASFKERKDGIATNYKDIIRTTDGGESWNWQCPIAPSPGSYTMIGLSIIDTSRYFMVINTDSPLAHYLCETSDGGKTWTKHPSVYQLNSITFSDSMHGYVVGESGVIIASSLSACSTPFAIPKSPSAGDMSISIFGINLPSNTMRLQWDWESQLNMAVTSTRVQLSSDPTLSSDFIVDTLLPVNSQMISSLVVGPISQRSQYYWRIAFRMDDSSYSPWSGPWTFMTAGGSIRGEVFNDLNRDRIRENDEPMMNRMPINVSGESSGVISTDSLGFYSIPGLDSGRYVIHPICPPGYRINGSDSIVVSLGLNDSIQLPPIPVYFPWNTIT
jgi:photosystem II stability/assembly factor-like uncharacterized protein